MKLYQRRSIKTFLTITGSCLLSTASAEFQSTLACRLTEDGACLNSPDFVDADASRGITARHGGTSMLQAARATVRTDAEINKTRVEARDEQPANQSYNTAPSNVTEEARSLSISTLTIATETHGKRIVPLGLDGIER